MVTIPNFGHWKVRFNLLIGGTILGPLIYTFSSEWALLFAGLIAGTLAFLIGGKNGK